MASPLAGSLAKQIYKGMKSLFLDATLTRDGANSGSVYDPTVASPTVYTCKAISNDDGEGVQGSDAAGASYATILILANSFKLNGAAVTVTPDVMDRIAIPSQGVSGVIDGGPSSNRAVTSDPAAATWLCRIVT